MPAYKHLTDEEKLRVTLYYNHYGLRATARKFEHSTKLVTRVVGETNDLISRFWNDDYSPTEAQVNVRKEFSALGDQFDNIQQSTELAKFYADFIAGGYYKLGKDELLKKFEHMEKFLLLINDSFQSAFEKFEEAHYAIQEYE